MKVQLQEFQIKREVRNIFGCDIIFIIPERDRERDKEKGGRRGAKGTPLPVNRCSCYIAFHPASKTRPPLPPYDVKCLYNIHATSLTSHYNGRLSLT